MATSKQFVKSNTNDSEETFDICCSPCADNDRIKEANTFCNDCASYFCEECLWQHNKFPALRSHIITDTSGQALATGANAVHVEGNKEDIPTCLIHHGQKIVKFCRAHGEVCCQTCVAAKHRSCNNTVALAEAAKDFRSSTDYQTKKSSLIELLASLSKEKLKKTENHADLVKEKKTLLDELEKYREELIKRINELAKAAKQEIDNTYKETEDIMQTNVSTIDTMIESATQTLNNLTTGNDTIGFLYLRTCTHIIEECRNLLQDFAVQTSKQQTVKYNINREVIDGFSQFKTLLLRDETQKEVGTYRIVSCSNVPFLHRKRCCTGICILSDGKVIVAIAQEQCLIGFDEGLKTEKNIYFSDNPRAVCQTGPNEVATCVGKKVQFIAVNPKLSCTSSIDVGCSCSGLAYIPDKKELIITCGSFLKVYKPESKTLSVSKASSLILTDAKLCTYSPELNLLLVADSDKGLIALNKDFELQWVFTDPQLRTAWGVCALSGGIILVCGYSSYKIFQLNKAGKQIGEFADGIEHAYSLAYDENKARLIIGCHSKELHIYTLDKTN